MQMSLDDFNLFKIDKPVRIIEMFGGYGSQSVSLKRLGIEFEHWKLVEWAVKSIQAYKDLHMPNDNTDYSKALTIEEIKKYLFLKGISNNYNEPMSEAQVNRLTEDKVRTIYNNIIATNNLVNITQVNAEDLEINDKDKYIYICSYSFPCQDISLAGNKKGFSDTSTRSGMLWEVERILKECKERNELPQVLLMENVPQIHNKKNMEDFKKWMASLGEMGYSNYWQDMIATDYGIPQTRNRTFMVSLLDGSYKFPQPIPLELKLKDLLENEVDEKYYLSDRGIKYICGNAINKELKDRIDRSKTKFNKEIAYTITTKQDRRCGDANFILDGYEETSVGEYLKIKNATKKGYLKAYEGDGVDISSRMEHHRGTVQKDKIQTLDCAGGEGHGVVVRDAYTPMERALFTEDGNIKRYINSDIIDEFKEGQMATTTFPNGYGHGPRTHNESIALNTIDKPSVKKDLRIRKLTPRECGRLMGLNDEEISLILRNQSDVSAYHLFGDSIVVNCLQAIIGTMI